MRNRKSRLIAGMLAIFLGMLGVHNFYLGHFGRGLGQLLLTSVGGLLTGGIAPVAVWMWSLFEGVKLLTGRTNHDAKGRPLS